MTPYLQALNRADITQLFPDCSATELALPDLTHVDWAVLDYLGWLHPSGHLGYVVVASEQGLQGMQLRRSLNHSARPRTRMCSWCHHVYRSRGTALFRSLLLWPEPMCPHKLDTHSTSEQILATGSLMILTSLISAKTNRIIRRV